jgi:hypothetical protein
MRACGAKVIPIFPYEIIHHQVINKKILVGHHNYEESHERRAIRKQIKGETV